MPSPVCQLLDIIGASRIEMMTCESSVQVVLAQEQPGRGLEETPALVGTQSSPQLSSQISFPFQDALILIFESQHPSFQQCHQPRTIILQEMPGTAQGFDLCQGHVPAKLPRPGMCSTSPHTSLFLVPWLDKSMEASCSLGAGEHLEGLYSSLNPKVAAMSVDQSRGPEFALPKPVCACLYQGGNNWISSHGPSFSSYARMELVVAPFLPGTVKSLMQSQSTGCVHPSLFRRKPNLML